MKRALPFLVILFLFTGVGLSQTIEYLDAGKHSCNKEDASFYRSLTYDGNGQPLGSVKEYYITGELAFEGWMISVRPDVLNGYCIWYYRNGQKMKEAFYKDGEIQGDPLHWDQIEEEGVLNEHGFFYPIEDVKEDVEELSDLLGEKLEIDSFTISMYLKIGVFEISQGDFKRSLLLFQLAYDMAKIIDHPIMQVRAYNNIGEVYVLKGNYVKALVWLNKAKRLAEMHALKEDIATSYSNIGNIFQLQGQLEQALIYNKHALEIREALGERENIAISYNNVGSIYKSKGAFVEALDYFNKAETIQIDLGLEEDLAISYNNIGGVYSSMGQYEEALHYYYKTQDIRERFGLESALATTYNNIGTIHHIRSQFEKALEWYEKSMKLRKQLEIEVGLANSYNNIGGIYFSKGQFDDAIEWFNKAIEIRKHLGLEVELASSYNEIGSVYDSKGALEEALSWYFRSKEIRERLNLEIDLATSYNNIGFVYHRLEHLDKAFQYTEKAIDLGERFGLEADLANSYNNIGGIYFSQRDFGNALLSFRKAQGFFERKGINGKLSVIYSNIGGVYLNQEAYDEALIWYNKARKIQEQLGLNIELAETYYNQAFLFFSVKQLDSCFIYAQKSVQINEEMRNIHRGRSSRQLFSNKNFNAIDAVIRCANILQQHKTAFSYSEKGKARGLVDLLSEQSVHLSKIPASLFDDYSRIAYQFYIINKRLNQDVSNVNRKNYENVRDSLLREKKELDDRIRVIAPEYANLIYPETVDERQVQKVLKDKEVVISFYAGFHKTFAFIITSNQLKMIDLGPSDNLNQMINQFRVEYLETQKEGLVSGSLLLQKRSEKIFFHLSRQLYKYLWEPLEATGLLTGNKIILIPDGFLNYLPFELLVNDVEQKTYSEYNYLIKKYSFNYYPSATVFHFERNREATNKYWGSAFFGLALSDFESNSCNHDTVFFNRLPFSVPEIEGIAKVFSQGEPLTIINEEASESALKILLRFGFRYLHFSTHGVIHPEQADLSHLLFRSSEDDDGCLNLYEIFEQKWNADLVTFSACETGLGKVVRGEGIMGFTRAIMHGGTPSMILSLWEVTDESTKDLFLDYYTKLAKDGADKYVPLRDTQLEMILSKNYSNPYYWAPFVFIGKRYSQN